eukprot:349634-Chlamydomonas_euryale.AAC.14
MTSHASGALALQASEPLPKLHLRLHATAAGAAAAVRQRCSLDSASPRLAAQKGLKASAHVHSIPASPKRTSLMLAVTHACKRYLNKVPQSMAAAAAPPQPRGDQLPAKEHCSPLHHASSPVGQGAVTRSSQAIGTTELHDAMSAPLSATLNCARVASAGAATCKSMRPDGASLPAATPAQTVSEIPSPSAGDAPAPAAPAPATLTLEEKRAGTAALLAAAASKYRQRGQEEARKADDARCAEVVRRWCSASHTLYTHSARD